VKIGAWIRLWPALLALLACGQIGYCRAAPRPWRADTNAPPLTAALTNAPLQELEPGIFQLGGVRLDKAKQSLEFAGVVNMNQGAVEYLIVHQTGKVHESIFRTSVEPYHLHVAALLLQRRPMSVNTNTGLAARAMTGPAARIFVRWPGLAPDHAVAGEEFVYNTRQKAPMQKGPWVYNGSRVLGGTFLAQRDGSIASVITDPDALLNGLRPGRDNDEIWQANTSAVPAVNSPVQITIEFGEPDRER
jgi:hypothetical protein